MKKTLYAITFLFVFQHSPSNVQDLFKQTTSIAIDSIPGSKNIPPAANQHSRLKVLTWNVQMLPRIGAIVSTNLRKMQTERTAWIIDHLESQDYDVIMLQECFDNDFIDAINVKLIRKYPFQVNPYRPKWYKLSNGLMILSKMPMHQIDRICFSQAAQTDIIVSKGAVRVKIFVDSLPITLVNTHLQADYEESKYGRIRAKQLEEIQSSLLAHDSTIHERIMIAGDLNVEENMNSTEYKDMMQRFKFIDLVYSFFKKPSISFDKNNFWNKEYSASSRLDYFLTNIKLTPIDIQIVKVKRKFFDNEIDLADHYGISAEFYID
jgi:endonuclease/exonuclease/phosphatase family metal-dependent hydrolase